MTPISSDAERRTALFAGSFDPFTVGHASVVERALPLFDRLVIAVGINAEKATATAAADRVAAIARLGDKAEITRFKGLGEISPDEFRDFIGPDMRLDRVTLRKDDGVDALLEFYMGKNTPERQDFIINNLVTEDDTDIL